MLLAAMLLPVSAASAAGSSHDAGDAPHVATPAGDGECASKAMKYLNDTLPAHWQYANRYGQGSFGDEQWWRMFNDSILDMLIDRGLDNNYNVAMAVSRMESSRQAMRQARAAYYPTVGLNASWSRTRSSGMGGEVPGNAVTSSAFDLGVNMSWEIDIFGKITSQVRAAGYDYRASAADMQAVRLALAAQIATDYFQLRVWQAEWQVAAEHTGRQLKVVNLTEARQEAGVGNKLEVAQSRGVYYSTKASIPVLENSIHTAINSLAVLVGEYPYELYPVLVEPRPLPDYHHIIPTGMPAELLQRRPDVVEAAMQLKARAEQLGIARKEYLPSLTLNGSIGTVAHRGGDLFSKQSLGYSVAPTLSWTLFDGLSRNAAVAQARQAMEQGIDSYNLTVMTAVEEVDNAMAAYMTSLRHIEAVEKVVEQSDTTLHLSIELYKTNLGQFYNVVSAQMDVLENQNTLIVAQGNALTSLVDLCKALGGGWQGL